jgi:hypothetical protein
MSSDGPWGGCAMEPIVLAAGTALVGAMATDTWQQTRAAVQAWWHKVHPGHADEVGAELVATRSQVLAARGRGDQDTEQALAGTWQLRLQQVLDEDPTLGPTLRQLLEEHLTPSLPVAEQTQIRHVIINARAGGHARQNIAGGDQQITGP